VADARDYDAIRSRARGREGWVDEMEGAALAGLRRAHALLAVELAPWDESLRQLSREGADVATVRRALLATLRSEPS
jgi:hypothetical protein